MFAIGNMANQLESNVTAKRMTELCTDKFSFSYLYVYITMKTNSA